MSTATDILFAPITPANPILPTGPWRIRCHHIVAMCKQADIRRIGYTLSTISYPPGALTLEQMVELYVLHGQTVFFEAGSPRHGPRYVNGSFIFDGGFGIEPDGYAHFNAGGCYRRSIVDAQLYPNNYNDHHVFATEQDARNYAAVIP